MSSSQPADDDLIGVTFAGRYRIISRLGAGGMGTAYRAWDEQAGVPVVVKIPSRARLGNATFLERFRREIRRHQRLSHPHIVPIVDVGEHEGLPFVVMQFLPGGSLSNRRLRDSQGKPKRNPPGMLHLWLPAVADALDYVHAQGLVHRDVKPANIFFDAFWGAHLGDFGIAKVVEESEAFDKEQTLTAADMGIGTGGYMAPEQFTPRAVIDGRADQYALAVMAYELVAGVRPFTGSTAHLVVEVTTQPVPPLDARRRDLPASFVEATHRGLAKNPNDRFATCGEFAAALLHDVQPIEDEPGVARLLCPKCANILKLTTAAAGRKGACPRCHTQMKVGDDLGVLWLLDEARGPPQAPAVQGAAVAGQEDGGKPAEDFTLAPLVVEPIESVTPTSGAFRFDKPTRARQTRGLAPAVIWGGAALAVLAAVVAWRLPRPEPVVTPAEEPAARPEPTLAERIAEAEAALNADPSDPVANEFLGAHWCFAERDWDKGLPYLAKAAGDEISGAAREEYAARETPPPNGGAFIRAARRWWAIATREPSAADARESTEAIAEHAAALYREHVEAVQSDDDVRFANEWLDGDDAFRDRVDDRRPVAMRPVDPEPPSSAEQKPLRLADFIAGLRSKTPEEILAREPLVNSVAMELKLLPPGQFPQGSDDDPTEKPVHDVRLTQPFFIGVREVTNAQWKAVMETDPPSEWPADELPVERVSWQDAMAFCERLSALPAEREAGRAYRLPTEAEWEYACRAGSHARWSCGPDAAALENHGWFRDNAGGRTHAAGGKQPNAWGLLDMHGNVSEWCRDRYGRYAQRAAQDPQGPSTGVMVVGRGGSWVTSSWGCRSAYRLGFLPDYRGFDVGIRVVMVPAVAGGAPAEHSTPAETTAPQPATPADDAVTGPVPDRETAAMADGTKEAPVANDVKLPDIFLCDLPEKKVSVGYGTLGKRGRLGFDGLMVQVGGKRQEHSLSMHPPSKGEARASFDVPAGYTHFRATAAMNDGGDAVTLLRFKLYGGERLLWTSRPLRKGGSTDDCVIALKGATTITLVVECPGRNKLAWAVWCDPVLLSR